jgi:hypothetical protein
MDRIQREQPVPRKLLRRASAARALDTSITMMKKLEAMGRLTPIVLGLRCVFYDVNEVEALARPTKRKARPRR